MKQQTAPPLASFSPRFESMLEQKIGFGKAQYLVTLPLSLILITEGAEAIAIGLLLPIIKT
jgi:hypothetical protein